MEQNLYRFYKVCGRMGFIQGFFLASQVEIDDLMGKDIYFGEALGKHSSISCIMNSDTISLISSDPIFIDKAKECGLIPNGHNPLNYLEE